MSKKLILFITVLALGFLISLTFSVAGRFSQPVEGALSGQGNSFNSNAASHSNNPVRDSLIEIFDSLNIEDKGSRESLAQGLENFPGQFRAGQEDFEEFRRIINLMITLLTDKDLFQRARAATILGNLLNDMAVMPLVVSLLHDPHFYVREHAAQALGKIRSRKATPYLIRAIGTDKSREVVNHAINSLGFLRDTRALDILIYILTGEESKKGEFPFFPFRGKKGNTRKNYNLITLSNTAIALGRIEDQEATPALVQALNHKSYLVRISAAQALSLIRDPEAIEPMEDRLEVETDDLVKLAIGHAIYQTDIY